MSLRSRRKIFTLSKVCYCGNNKYSSEQDLLYCSKCHPLAGFRYIDITRPLLDFRLTPLLILFNMFLYLVFSTFFNSYDLFELSPSAYYFWSSDNTQILNGELYRLITSIFLHLDIFHLLFNMILLIFIGYKAENMYGVKYAFIIYVLAGMGGNIASLIDGPFHNSLGSSGAIIGLYGATVIKQRYRLIIKIILMIIFLYIVSLASSVNLYSHVFGLLVGVSLAYLFIHEYHNLVFYFEDRLE